MLTFFPDHVEEKEQKLEGPELIVKLLNDQPEDVRVDLFNWVESWKRVAQHIHAMQEKLK